MQSARFGRTILATSICVLLSAPVMAVESEGSDYAELVLSSEQTNIATVKLMTLHQAVSSFYTANLRWPSSLTELSTGTDVYFIGDFSTPFGTITGAANGANSYTLQISVPTTPSDFRRAQYENLAGSIGGDYVANSVQLNIPVPYTASVAKNMLQRTEDASGFGLNEMLTDLSLGDNDITNIKKLAGEDIELTGTLKTPKLESIDASIDTIQTQSLNVNKTADIKEGSADSANFNEFVINDKLEADSFNYDSLDIGELTVSDQSVIDSITVSERGTIDYLDAERVDFDYGSFTASLSAINAEANKLIVDEFMVDSFVGPVTFNSPVMVNDVTQAMGPFTVNGPLTQSNGTVNLGQTEIQSNLTTGYANLGGDVQVDGNFTAKTANFLQNVEVLGRTSLEALLGTSANVSNKVFVNGSANVTNELRLNGDLMAGNKVIARDGAWYENGQKVTERYYGLNDKVANAEKLGGKDSSLLAVKSRNNVFRSATTFSRDLRVNNAVRSASGLLIDSSGRLYDRGVLVSSKYAKKTDVTSATNEINSKIAQIESIVQSAVNQKQSQLTGYRNRINTVRGQQSSINTNNNSSLSLLAQADSNLTTANNYYRQANSTLQGGKTKVNALNSLGNTVKSMAAYRTTIVNHTHTIYKEGDGGGSTLKWQVVGTTCSHVQPSATAGASCSAPGARAFGAVVGTNCNLSGNPVNPSWGPTWQQLECK
ncbi:hypothetical protein M3899_003286 [Vibrio parahaemolyticus]|nr:hypothetical protein [Vibrio parahaemolyticus]